MTSLSDDFEIELRSAVLRLRPEGPAPASLRGMVDAIPDTSAHEGLVQRLLRGSPAAVGVAVLAGSAAIAVLAIGLQPGVLLPSLPPSGGPTVAHFDPTIRGPEVVYGVVSSLLIVPGIVALLAVGFAVRIAVRRGRRMGARDRLHVIVAGAVALAAVALAATPGFEWSSFYAPVQGLGVQVNPPPGDTQGTPTWYETVDAGEPVILAVGIQNRALLPIRLDGLVEDANAKDTQIYHWTGLTTRGMFDPLPEDPTQLPAFTPVVVEPGGYLDLYLVATAGPCVFGRDFVLDAPDVEGYASRGRDVVLAYSVLGLQSSAPFQLPVNLIEPVRHPCTAAESN